MSCGTRRFGTTSDGREVQLYTLENENGMRVGIISLGACIQSVSVPDAAGNLVDVTLGFDGVEGYQTNAPDFGAIVGRNANRIGKASFELGGTTYHLAQNDGENNLHSGPHMYFQRIWKLEEPPHTEADGSTQLVLGLLSRSGDQGFPGALDIRVRYVLTMDNRLELRFEATPSTTTIVNLTCHAYWNLNGHASGSVLSHRLQLEAESYTPSDEHLIPTGEITPVDQTPYDFRSAHALGDAIDLVPGGYDTNFVLRNQERIERVATLTGDETRIVMDVYSDAPGMQVYSSGGLRARGKGGAHHGPFDAVVLETQFYPDAPHHKNFPQPIYTPEHPFISTTAFAFGVEG